jgi:hypothetical protein
MSPLIIRIQRAGLKFSGPFCVLLAIKFPLRSRADDLFAQSFFPPVLHRLQFLFGWSDAFVKTVGAKAFQTQQLSKSCHWKCGQSGLMELHKSVLVAPRVVWLCGRRVRPGSNTHHGARFWVFFVALSFRLLYHLGVGSSETEQSRYIQMYICIHQGYQMFLGTTYQIAAK